MALDFQTVCTILSFISFTRSVQVRLVHKIIASTLNLVLCSSGSVCACVWETDRKRETETASRDEKKTSCSKYSRTLIICSYIMLSMSSPPSFRRMPGHKTDVAYVLTHTWTKHKHTLNHTYSGSPSPLHTRWPFLIAENASEKDKRDFLNELTILKQVGKHPNVVCLVGACHIQGKQELMNWWTDELMAR